MCSKVRYDTRRKAIIAIREIAGRRTETGRVVKVCRAYPCGECGGWHLTSRPGWYRPETKEVR